MKRIASLLLLLALTPGAPAQGAKSFEKSMAVPKSTVTLGWSSGRCTIVRVTPKNYPSAEDIEHARHEDRDDKSWLWWEFYVTNDRGQKCEVEFWVDILDRSGRVVKSSDRSGSLSEDERDDEFRVSTLVRTLDIVEGRAKIRGEIR